MQLEGRHYENGEPIRVTIDGERILRVDPIWPVGDVDELPWIAPGLFDLQINGHGGTWFGAPDLTADQVIAALKSQFRFGITRLLPTLITNSFEALSAGFAAIREACEREPWVAKMVPGCHLEGPYISPLDGPRGAHPLEHVRPADWHEFQQLQEISGGRIRLVTLAPEIEGANEFISQAVDSGVVVALGHTAAEPEQIQAAVAAGARLSTHLGNGAHGTIRRHPNYIWEQLGSKELWASLIADGHHLPTSVLRSMISAKGLRRAILTCDAAGLAGCPPGEYQDGSMDVELLEDGRIVLAGQEQLLAGSSLATDSCIANVVSSVGLSLKAAIDMAGRNPAVLLGYEEIRLKRGGRADLFLFRLKPKRLDVQATIAAGKLQFGELN